MNWGIFLKYALQALTMVPSVVVSIEQMSAGAKSGATKKQLAMQALGLASDVAQNVLPEHQKAIDAATELTSNAIDNTVALYNAVHPDFQKTAAPAPAPAVLAPVAAPVEAPVVTAPVVTAPAAEAPEITSDNVLANLTGPGLHNVVPA